MANPPQGALMYLLHSYPDTAGTVVRLVLAELGLSHEVRMIDRPGGELATSRYRAKNPLGLIPALDTPDGVMFETGAMLLYLSDRHPGLAPHPDAPERAGFLSWFFMINNGIHPTLLQLYYPERVAGAEHVPAVLSHARSRVLAQLALVEAMLAKDAPVWLSASQPLLGYYLGILLRWLADAGPSFVSQDFPALHRALSQLETRPAVRLVAMAESLGPRPFTQPRA